MKQSLQLKLGQQLTMTPQLQQAIRLLQLSTLDLQNEIQEALENNPMLEASEGDENVEPTADSTESNPEIRDSETPTPPEQHSSETELNTSNADAPASDASSSNDLDTSDYEDIPKDLEVDTSWDDIYQSAPAATGLSRPDTDDMDYDSRRASSETLQDHLLWQLNLTPMSDLDSELGEAIVDAIDPNGMLTQSIEDIWQGMLTQYPELELDEVVAVLHRVQQFDPPGVASQDLSECLMLQLKQLPDTLPAYKVASSLIANYLPLLGSRDFKQLMRKLKVKEKELKDAVSIIQSLNPRPGESIGDDNTQYVIPDVFVRKDEDRWFVQLNPDIAPKLRINSDYAALVKRADNSDDNNYLRDNLQEARWFIKSLQSRNETLLKVATCIVEKQRGFLDSGPEAMRPMVLHDVAEIVDMHESTISRVTTQKFMHTPQGIFELKYFFSSHVSTESGGECSSTAIRAIIKKLIAAENPKKPLSDSKITAVLAEQGIQVARRTIAKYRESLGIAPSNERKRLV